MRSSLLTIMKPNVFGDVDPSIKTNAYVAGPVYQPPDRPAPWTVPPDESEPFAPLIAASRRFLTPEEERDDRRGQLRTVHSKPHHGYRGNREATARALNVSVDSNTARTTSIAADGGSVVERRNVAPPSSRDGDC